MLVVPDDGSVIDVLVLYTHDAALATDASHATGSISPWD